MAESLEISSSESEFDADFSGEDFSVSDLEEEREEPGGIDPYMYEPEVESDESDNNDEIPGVHNDGEDLEGRLGNNNWCYCGFCVVMPVVRESVCCKELEQVVLKMDEQGEQGAAIDCITEHEGFYPVCLNRHVLDTAYLHYRQEYGNPRQDATQNQKYRHTAYRQMARWCWGFLGRSVHVPLPSCTVAKIRAEYPSHEYRGFEEI